MSTARWSTSGRWLVVAVMVGVIAACGSDDADDAGGAPVVETAPVDAEPAEPSEPVETTESDDPVDSSADGGDEPSDPVDSPDADPGDDEGPPEVDTGTVIVAGQTSTLTGPSRSDAIIDPDLADPSGDFDFEICETVNPAFAGEVNIVGTLNDGTPFRLSGNVDDMSGDLDGFALGDTLDEEVAANTAVTLDGRTLSGTATTSRGDVEFTFTC